MEASLHPAPADRYADKVQARLAGLYPGKAQNPKAALFPEGMG